jgi:methyl-accepting chemotaxis protein
MTLKQRIYVQFLVAILPLALLIAYQAFSSNDLPERVTAALKSYDLSLEAGNAFKQFTSGVADAIDTGKLGSNAIAALERAKASEDKLAAVDDTDRLPGERIARVLAAVSANSSVGTVMPLKNEVQALRTALSESSDRKRQVLSSLVEEQETIARKRRELVVIAGGGALLLVAFTGYVLRRLVLGITRPIAHSVAVANAIAGGRLDNTIEVKGDDEIAQLLRAMEAMQQHLCGIVRSVRAGAESVAEASEILSSETRDLSHRSEAQAASLEEAAASMEELSTTVRENSGNAKQANVIAQGAAKSASGGSASVRRVVGTMQEISASSRRIEDIVGVIDAIAFQTNILALNAAVEAARAGEHGRGFAVVASEVRSLSQRCATAATEIKELVTTSVARVESGGAQADDAGTSIDALVADVERVSALMSEIAAAGMQQQRGIEQVTTSVTQMDGAVQQNAIAVQRSAAAAEKLKRDARELAQTVSRFKLRDEASPAETSSPSGNGGDTLFAAPVPLLRSRQA